jgi:drug/metabolite transporter (DMT)-like permease
VISIRPSTVSNQPAIAEAKTAAAPTTPARRLSGWKFLSRLFPARLFPARRFLDWRLPDWRSLGRRFATCRFPALTQASIPPLLVAAMWGANSVLVKYMVQGFAPLEVQTVRMVLAALLLLPFAGFSFHSSLPAEWGGRQGLSAGRRQRPGLFAGWPWRLDLPAGVMRLAAATACTTVLLHQILLAYGMLSAKAGLGALILSLIPLATALLAHAFLGERLAWRQALGVLLGFGGVLTAVGDEWWRGGFAVGRGEVLVLGAMLTYAVGAVFVKRARGLVSPLQFTALVQALGGAMLLLVSAVNIALTGLPTARPSMGFWLLVTVSAFLATGLGNVYWNRSIQELGATRTSIFLNVMPFMGLITAFLLFGEPVMPAQLAGLAGVVCGIWLSIKPDEKRRLPRAGRKVLDG